MANTFGREPAREKHAIRERNGHLCPAELSGGKPLGFRKSTPTTDYYYLQSVGQAIESRFRSNRHALADKNTFDP